MKETLSPLSSSSSTAAPAEPEGAPRHPDGGWMPRPWKDELGGCVFLPRVLDKARRRLLGEAQGQDLMNGYLFGDFDYADGMVLRFLRATEDRVLELLREGKDDAAVAEILFQEGRRSPEQIAAWSRRFRWINAPFGPMWDADEGRRAPGLSTSLLNGFYNYLMMPVVYVFFGMLTRIRQWRRS